MVRIGIVGIGFMGMTHYLAARQLHKAQVVAICSRDPKKRAGDWRGIRGNFGPPGEIVDLTGIATYDNLDALLADPAIDLVDICNPTNLHAETALRTLAAGKHVLVEKPIALEPADANAMVAAANKVGKLLMVGQVLPFFPEFAFAADAIQSGRWGQLRAGHLKRVIARPDWSTASGDAAKTGGPAVDLHIHDTHFIRLLCGMPESVFSTGFVESGVVQYVTTQYCFGAAGPVLSCTSGALAMPGRPFVHGFELYLDSATLVFECDACPLTVLTNDGKIDQPRLNSTDVIATFTAELQAAVDGVRTCRGPEVLSGELARDALVLCHKECESLKRGAIVKVAD